MLIRDAEEVADCKIARDSTVVVDPNVVRVGAHPVREQDVRRRNQSDHLRQGPVPQVRVVPVPESDPWGRVGCFAL